MVSSSNTGRKALKIQASVLSLLFFWNTVAYADGIGSIQPLIFSSRPDISQTLHVLDELSTAATIKKYSQGSHRELVVLIQDAHVNEEAQRNIVRILKYLKENFGLKQIALEGASGELNAKMFSFFPNQQARIKASDYYLKAGRLTGAEYWAVVDRAEVKLFGAEDKKLYEQNRDVFLELRAQQEKNLGLLQETTNLIHQLSRFVLAPELLELLRKANESDQNSEAYAAYLRYQLKQIHAQQINLANYPGLQALEKLLAMESVLDFVRVESELNELSETIQADLKRGRAEKYLKPFIDYQEGRMDKRAFYEHLRALAQKKFRKNQKTFETQFPTLPKYWDFLAMSEYLSESVVEESHQLTRRFYEKWIHNTKDKTFVRLWELMRIYEKLFRFALTKDDVDFLVQEGNHFRFAALKFELQAQLEKHHFEKNFPENLSDLDNVVLHAKKFYDLALSRDQVLIEAALRRMQASQDKTIAIITGGFHTPGIENYLKLKKYPYVILTPKISQKEDQRQQIKKYEDALLEKPLPLDQRLNRFFQKNLAAEITNPTYQLLARLMLPSVDLGTRFLEPNSGNLRSELRATAYFNAIFHESMQLGKPEIAIREIETAAANQFSRSELRAVSSYTQRLAAMLNLDTPAKPKDPYRKPRIEKLEARSVLSATTLTPELGKPETPTEIQAPIIQIEEHTVSVKRVDGRVAEVVEIFDAPENPMVTVRETTRYHYKEGVLIEKEFVQETQIKGPGQPWQTLEHEKTPVINGDTGNPDEFLHLPEEVNREGKTIRFKYEIKDEISDKTARDIDNAFKAALAESEVPDFPKRTPNSSGGSRRSGGGRVSAPESPPIAESKAGGGDEISIFDLPLDLPNKPEPGTFEDSMWEENRESEPEGDRPHVSFPVDAPRDIAAESARDVFDQALNQMAAMEHGFRTALQPFTVAADLLHKRVLSWIGNEEPVKKIEPEEALVKTAPVKQQAAEEKQTLITEASFFESLFTVPAILIAVAAGIAPIFASFGMIIMKTLRQLIHFSTFVERSKKKPKAEWAQFSWQSKKATKEAHRRRSFLEPPARPAKPLSSPAGAGAVSISRPRYRQFETAVRSELRGLFQSKRKIFLTAMAGVFSFASVSGEVLAQTRQKPTASVEPPTVVKIFLDEVRRTMPQPDVREAGDLEDFLKIIFETKFSQTIESPSVAEQELNPETVLLTSGTSKVGPYRQSVDQVGMVIQSPANAKGRIPDWIRKKINAIKPGQQKVVYVQKGDVTFELKDEALELEIEKEKSKLVNYAYHFGRIYGVTFKSMPKEAVDAIRAWIKKHQDKEASYDKEKARALELFPMAGAGHEMNFYNSLLRYAQLKYQQRINQQVLAPADGYILTEELANDGNVSAGQKLYVFIPVNRFQTKIKVPVEQASRNVKLHVQDTQGKKFPIRIIEMPKVEFVMEDRAYVIMTIDCFLPEHPRGLMRNVYWEIYAESSEDVELWSKTVAIVDTTEGVVSRREIETGAAPQLVGQWQLAPGVTELSWIQEGDLIGQGAGAKEYFGTIAAEFARYEPRAQYIYDFLNPASLDEAWERVVITAIPSYDDNLNNGLRDFLDGVRDFRERPTLAGTQASHSGLVRVIPEKIDQTTKPGEPVVKIYPQWIDVGGVRVLEEYNIGLGSVLIVQAHNGQEFLGRVMDINPEIPNENGQDWSAYDEITGLRVFNDAGLVLADHAPVQVKIPAAKEQKRLKAELSEIETKAESEAPAADVVARAFPVSFVVSPDSALIQRALFQASSATQHSADQENPVQFDEAEILLQSLLQDVNPDRPDSNIHQRIRATQDFIAQYKSHPKFYEFLHRMIFEGPDDVVRQALQHYRDEEKTLALVNVYRELLEDSPKSFAAQLAESYMIELLESDSKKFATLTSESRTNPEFRKFVIKFFRAFIRKQMEREQPSQRLLLQIVRSDFWSQEELVHLIKYSENTEEINFFSVLLKWRIAVQKNSLIKHGMSENSITQYAKTSEALSPELADDVRLTDQTVADDQRYLTQSPSWNDLSQVIDADLETKMLEAYGDLLNSEARPEKTDNADEDEVFDLNAMHDVNDPIFSQMDFKAQAAAIQALAQNRQYYDLMRLLRQPEIAQDHGRQVIDLMNDDIEGRFQLASIYNDTEDRELLTMIQDSDFTQLAVEDLIAFQTQQPDSIQAVATRGLYQQTFVRMNERSKTPTPLYLHALYALTIPGDSELGMLVRAPSSSHLGKRLTQTGLEEAEIISRANHEIDDHRIPRRAIEIMQAKEGLFAMFQHIPGVKNTRTTTVEELAGPRRSDVISLAGESQRLLARGEIQDKDYRYYLRLEGAVRDSILTRTSAKEAKLANLGLSAFTQMPLLRSVGIGVFGLISMGFGWWGISLAYHSARFKKRNPAAVQNDLDALMREAGLGRNERSELRLREKLSKLMGHRSKYTIDPYKDSDLKDTFEKWSTLLGQDRLGPMDYTQIRKLAKKGLHDKKIRFQADFFRGILGQWDYKSVISLLGIFLKLINLTLQRFQNDAEEYEQERRHLDGNDPRAEDLRLLIREIMYHKQELQQLAQALTLLRSIMGKINGLRTVFSYQRTRILYPSHIRYLLPWFSNRIQGYLFMFIRVVMIKSLRAHIALWGWTGGIKALFGFRPAGGIFAQLRQHMALINELEPGTYDGKVVDVIQAKIRTYCINTLRYNDLLDFDSAWELRKLLSRLLIVGTFMGSVVYAFATLYLGHDWFNESAFYISALTAAFLVALTPLLGAAAGLIGFINHIYPMLSRWGVPGDMSLAADLRYHIRTTRKFYQAITGESLDNLEHYHGEPLKMLEYERTVLAEKRELDPSIPASADLVVIVSRSEEGAESGLVAEKRRLIERHLRQGTPVASVLHPYKGSGDAYSFARETVLNGWNDLRQKYSGLPEDPYNARIVYLLAGGWTRGGFSLILGRDYRPLGLDIEDDDVTRPYTTLEYALATAYRGTRGLFDENRGGEVVVSTDSVHIGPVTREGDVTYVGSFGSIREIVEGEYDVIFDPFGRNANYVLFHPTPNELKYEIERARKSPDHYIDFDNEEVAQLVLDGNILIVSPESRASYEGLNRLMSRLRRKVEEKLSPEEASDFAFRIQEHIFHAQLLVRSVLAAERAREEHESSTADRHEAVRITEGLRAEVVANPANEILAAHAGRLAGDPSNLEAYTRRLALEMELLSIHLDEARQSQPFDIALSVAHSSQSSTVDLREPSAFLDFVSGVKDFGPLNQSILSDPQMAIDVAHRRMVIHMNGQGAELLRRIPANTVVARVPMQPTNVGDQTESVLFFMGIDDDMRQKGKELMTRAVDRQGRRLFLDETDFEKAPFFPRNPDSPTINALIEMMHQIPHKDQPLVLPVDSREELNQRFASWNEVAQHRSRESFEPVEEAVRSEMREAEPNLSDWSAAIAETDRLNAMQNRRLIHPAVERASEFDRDLAHILEATLQNYVQTQFGIDVSLNADQPGVYIFEYDPARHSYDTILQMIQNKPASVEMVVTLSESALPAKRKEIHDELQAWLRVENLQNHVQLPSFYQPGWSLRRFVSDKKDELKRQLNRNRGRIPVLAIDESMLSAQALDRQYLDQIYLAALSLAYGSIVLAGQPEPMQGADHIPITQALAAAQRFAQSA